MTLRELVNTAHAVIVSSFDTKEQYEDFDRELNLEPGQELVPVSRGTDKLMALFASAARSR